LNNLVKRIDFILISVKGCVPGSSKYQTRKYDSVALGLRPGLHAHEFFLSSSSSFWALDYSRRVTSQISPVHVREGLVSGLLIQFVLRGRGNRPKRNHGHGRQIRKSCIGEPGHSDRAALDFCLPAPWNIERFSAACNMAAVSQVPSKRCKYRPGYYAERKGETSQWNEQIRGTLHVGQLLPRSLARAHFPHLPHKSRMSRRAKISILLDSMLE